MQIFADKIFENPIKVIEAFDNEGFIEAFSQIEILRKRHYLLGYIRYEAKEIFLGRKIKSKYPLLYFEVFKEAKMHRCIDAKKNPSDLVIQSLSHLIDYKTYKKAIQQIKKEIACGNTYQVNYTYDYKIETDLDGFELYKNILPRQKTHYNAYIKNKYEEILSFSPELFFELERGINSYKIKTKPMKGTVKRGKTEAQDQKNIEFLKNDIKNRAENVMIVDLLRNDLGKIAKTGTVKVDKLFEVETHKTVHQMTSEISAELDENITFYDIFEALFPCGSVTGTPKINTMEIIDRIEIDKRNVYCGAIGLISPEKTVFSVPIRILQGVNGANNKKTFLCRVGGAVVWDSTPKDEWEETLTKIKFLNSPNEGGLGNPPYKLTSRNDVMVGRAYLPDNIKLIETILVKNGKMKYKAAHFARMKKSAKELGFKFDLQNVKSKVQNVGWDCHPAMILRILLNKEGVLEMQSMPLNKIKTNKISISKTPVNINELLLQHKTTYRPWYSEAMERIKKGEIFDEIFFNKKDELTEGARSNIILQIGGKLFTPSFECGLLKGVLRQKLLSQDKIKEKKLYLEDLKKAEKIYCINSVRGVIEVEIQGEGLL